MPEQWLTVQDAAEQEGCTQRAVYGQIAAGRLVAYRIPARGIRIKQSDLDEFLTPKLLVK